MERICDTSSGGSRPVSGQEKRQEPGLNSLALLRAQIGSFAVIKSNVEKQIQRAAGSRSGGPFESQAVPSDDRQQREFTAHLNTYYNEVISCIRDAESILIFGPGESKGELKKHLEQEGLGGRIVGIETTDKMTDPQIAAKVRRYFLNQK